MKQQKLHKKCLQRLAWKCLKQSVYLHWQFLQKLLPWVTVGSGQSSHQRREPMYFLCLSHQAGNILESVTSDSLLVATYLFSLLVKINRALWSISVSHQRCPCLYTRAHANTHKHFFSQVYIYIYMHINALILMHTPMLGNFLLLKIPLCFNDIILSIS